LAKPARKLKVFQAQFGFYDTVVAAPSQAAALRAWGVHQNLFASGEARIADDADAVKAALAHPETPLKRAVGSKDPFGLEAALPHIPDAPKRKAAAKAKPAPPAKPPADRGALDAAEAALEQLDEARKREEAALRREQDALDARKSASQSAYVAARKDATAAVVKAREGYRKAGGRD
jgi:type IV secretory pathway VirB10-like protein